jgi:hypothetical protein
MHEVDFLAEIRLLGFRRERQPRRLLDRQRVHVRAKCDRAAGLVSLEHADDARPPHARAHLQTQAP